MLSFCRAIVPSCYRAFVLSCLRAFMLSWFSDHTHFLKIILPGIWPTSFLTLAV